MAISCPIRAEKPRSQTTSVLSRKRNPPPGPVTRPTFITSQAEIEDKIKAATLKVAAAYDQYQFALAELRTLGGPLPDPGVDPRQLRFDFTEEYIVERFDIVQPNPALYGPWSSQLTSESLKMNGRPRAIPRITPPECRACLIRLAQPIRISSVNSKSQDDRMREIIDQIYAEANL